MQTFEEIAQQFSVKTLPESEVELVGAIPAETLQPYTHEALKHFTEELELPGFRKGHVPEHMVRQRIGEVPLLEEAVEMIMQKLYPALLTAHQLDAVGRPDIRITKLAPGNPAELTVHVAIYPHLELPKDWKTVGKAVPEEAAPTVTDTEVDEALTSIRRARAKADSAADPKAELKEEDLPALNDAFAQSLGQFTDVADLKTKLRENMTHEKEQRAKEVRRGKIIEELLKKIEVAVPAIFIESELEKIMGQMKDDISRIGMDFGEYLKRVGKTEEDIRGEFRDQAAQRAKLQLTLNKIAEDEKIEADETAVETEMKHALEHFPDARPDLVKVHIETVLRNEKVLQMLEGK